MYCPRCEKVELAATVSEHTSCCAKCGGVFIRSEGLHVLVQKARAPGMALQEGTRLQSWLAAPRFIETDPPIACPKCRYNMYLVENSGVELDFCLNCEGMWFDRGELDIIYERLRSGEIKTLTPGPIASDDHDSTLIFHMLNAIRS